MADKWQEKSKADKKATFDGLQALYAKEPVEIPVKPPQKPKVKRSKPYQCRDSESEIQARVVKWARSIRLPLISIPNHGKRSAWQGLKEKAMGLTPGVSDLFLARPANGKAGLWLELKSYGRIPTNEQFDWLKRMQDEGYCAVWCDNYDKAIKIIMDYLGMV